MERKITKIAGIEFTQEDIKELEKKYFEENKKYIVKYKTIYELAYHEPRFDKLNEGYFGAREVYKNYDKKSVGYTKKGRFFIMNAKSVNELIGREFFVEG